MSLNAQSTTGTTDEHVYFDRALQMWREKSGVTVDFCDMPLDVELTILEWAHRLKDFAELNGGR